MSELTKKEKHQLVIELANKHGITSYEFGQKTTLTDAGAFKVLSGQSKNPHNSTLNIMLEYIESKIVGKEVPGHENHKVEESETEYIIDNETLFKAKVLKSLDYLEKAIGLTLLNTDDIMDTSKFIKGKVTSIDKSFNGLPRIIENSLAKRNS